VRFDPDKYRRRSIRLQGYDYSQPGAYFVTICTHGQQNILGDVIDDSVHMSPLGEIVGQMWRGLPGRFERVELDQFVVMPNHVHGIIVITPVVGVGAIHELPLRELPRQSKAQRRRMLLPKVIGYFKMNASKVINELRGTPGGLVWQRNYYEHIVRGDGRGS